METNQCLPVPAAARPPKGHWRAHSAAAPCRRGAYRACCAPRKWRFGLIILYNGFANQPSLACTGRRATPKGVERALGSGTLPPYPAAAPCRPLNMLGIMRNQPYTAENSPAAPEHTTSLSLSCKFFLTAFGVKALRRNTERNTFPSSVVTSIGSAPL